MKFGIVLVFAALLGDSLAREKQAIHTGAEKTVAELIAYYESLVGRLVPDYLLALRATRTLRSESGGQRLNDGHTAWGEWRKEGSNAGSLSNPYDPFSGLSLGEFTFGGGMPRDGSVGGSPSSPKYSSKRGPAFYDGFVAGGLTSRGGSTIGGLPHTYDSFGAGQLSSEGLTAAGRKQRNGPLQGGLSSSGKTAGGDLGLTENSVDGKSRRGSILVGLPNTYVSAGEDRASSKDSPIAGDGYLDEVLSPAGDRTVDGRTPNYSPFRGSVSSTGQIVGDRNSRNGWTTGGLARTYDSVGGMGRAAGDRKLGDGSTTGGLARTYNSVGESNVSNGLVAEHRESHDGSTTGGLVRTYDSVGESSVSDGLVAEHRNSRDGPTTGGLARTYDSVGESSVSNGHVSGHRKSRDGFPSGSLAHTHGSMSEALLYDNNLTGRGQVPPESKVEFDIRNPKSPNGDNTSNEGSESGGLSPKMKEEIDKVKVAFILSVSPNYDGMSNRRLWKTLISKRSKLEASKLQVQHLLYIKQEMIRKLQGWPLEYHVPSKALSTAIIRDIEKILAYRPVGYNSY